MLGERLKNGIADLILAGSLRPGDRLDEQELAERFGVSRTPVREALHQLAVAGLVEMRPRRPTLVRRLSNADLADSFEALGEIEGLCARYAAERMTHAERLQLREIMQRAAAAVAGDDAATYRELDAEFHSLIHAGAHNVSLRRIAEQVRMQTAPYSSAPYTMQGYTPQISVPHGQHEAVVAAVLDRDPARAQAAMIDHISLSSITIQGILNDRAAGDLAGAAAVRVGAGKQ
ncbi:GntR family transcriptional regulator [Kumtagia ephedrae]|uniref:GntR family transcriptional regulator n=1 Tax=Kumtagia ephedrae TaxID=2116701 RepID=A0A2P7SRN2_9HYPH|nr:GntR family transcriptional regulator [Mesorhizobium ephedrae]PSJ65130.1 GntR family transcriptional regulator [Mesorhizobium ephedrae]